MSTSHVGTDEGDRLAALGYRQELARVLSLFDNFSVAFAYLSPMVGIYSLYVLGLATGGPRYIWTIPIVVGLMMLVALVFGELASEYPLSGALYQYGKYNVGPRYGWYVGWIYGFALLATVASVDSGAVLYIVDLINLWFKTDLNPTNHVTIFVIVALFFIVSGALNAVGAKIMGRVANLGVYVETIGTFGVFLALAIHGFHQGFGFLFTTQHVQVVSQNAFGVNLGGNWWLGAALVAVLANAYIFYGFESAGDISEETVNAHRSVPRAMRSALLYGGIASFVLVMGLLLATPKAGIAGVVSGGIPVVLAQLPSYITDFFLVMLLVLINPSKPIHILWFFYPANVNALYALVSFGVSGIYLSFFLTVLGSFIARSRGWKPSGSFTLGKWGIPVTVAGMTYLLVMFVNICWPSSLASGRALFNYGWITLLVMAIIVIIGGLYEFIARPDRKIATHRVES